MKIPGQIPVHFRLFLEPLEFPEQRGTLPFSVYSHSPISNIFFQTHNYARFQRVHTPFNNRHDPRALEENTLEYKYSIEDAMMTQLEVWGCCGTSGHSLSNIQLHKRGKNC